MKWVETIKQYLFKRDITSWKQILGSDFDESYLRTKSGVAVSPATAMNCSVVYACVKGISEDVAYLPFPVYKRLDRGKEKVRDHYVAKLLNNKPNPIMSAGSFRQAMMKNTLLTGNAYAEIERNNAGKPIALWPINPNCVEVRIVNNELLYYVQQGTDSIKLPAVVVAAKDMLHIADLSDDGICGKSPITQARESIALALAAEKFGAEFFGGNTTPTALLEPPSAITPEQKQQIREGWTRDAKGRGLVIPPFGFKYTAIGTTPEDSQFLQTRQFQVAEICRWFRYPPHMVGDLNKATFNNIEEQGLDYITNTLRCWLERWEDEVNRKLFNEAEQDTYFAEHLLDARLRGDITTRYAAYNIGLQNGYLSRNDVRDMEGMPPIDGGDTYLVPLNMAPVAPAGAAATAPDPTADPTAPVDPNAPVEPTVDVQASAFNGAQTDSFLAIQDKIVSGQYGKKQGYLSLTIAYPSTDKNLLQELVDSIEVKILNTEQSNGAKA